MFKRVVALQSFVHRIEATGAELVYRVGEFYHVAEEHIEELVQAGKIELEDVRAARLKQEASDQAAAAAVVAAAKDTPTPSSTGAAASAAEGNAAAENKTQPPAPE